MFTFLLIIKTDIVHCLISLFAESFAENVINKAFDKHAVVSFTGTWVETIQHVNNPNKINAISLSVRE